MLIHPPRITTEPESWLHPPLRFSFTSTTEKNWTEKVVWIGMITGRGCMIRYWEDGMWQIR